MVLWFMIHTSFIIIELQTIIFTFKFLWKKILKLKVWVEYRKIDMSNFTVSAKMELI